MSAPRWKPGDVAMAVGKYDAFMVVRTLGGGGGDYWSAPRGWPARESSDPDVRPLVVIDPEDREQVERLAVALGARGVEQGVVRGTDVDIVPQVFRANLAEALRSLVTDPKPEEPQGLGAVVEDADRVLWIRTEGFPRAFVWRPEGMQTDYSDNRYWSKVNAVRVLSEGWSE